jgi:hypothetical protein
MTKKARFVKNAPGNYRGDAQVYEVTPALDGHNYVLVSAIDLEYAGSWPGAHKCETFIFPYDMHADKVKDFGELDGSESGIKDHAKVLANAGYEIVG